MKNTIKVFGIIAIVAVIGLAMAACGEEPVTFTSEDKEVTSSGQLTITGLSAYNGRKINAYGSGLTSSGDSVRLFAYQTAYNVYSYEDGKLVNIEAGHGTDGTITGGQVTLKVFGMKINSYGGEFASYTGNDLNVSFGVMIDNSSVGSVMNVNFNNGVGSGAFVPD